MSHSIRVVVADDHPVVRSGIVAILATDRDLIVVAEASTGREAIAACKRFQPDVAIIDLSFPDASGVDVLREVRASSPAMRLLALTVSQREEDARRALAAGANGYLVKAAGGSEILRAIRRILGGGTFVDDGVALAMRRRPQDEELTGREMEVLQLMASGDRNDQIAERLRIGVATVKTHALRIFRKLHVNSRSKALLAAIERGIVTPRDN